jgi:predicted nuclease with RNAse H fold
MSLKPIPEDERLRAALVVARHLYQHCVEFAELHPTGTRFTPIGTDGDILKVLVETPEGVDTVARILQASSAH